MSRKKCSINENTLGGRLRLFRESQNIKIVPFAELLGISHGSLSNLENSKQKPSSEPISALIQKTNINIYWLFTGEGEMTRDQPSEFSSTNPINKGLLRSVIKLINSSNQKFIDKLEILIKYYEFESFDKELDDFKEQLSQHKRGAAA